MGNRRHYEDEFKDQAVRLALESDNSIPEVASDLAISPGNLRRWIREHRERGTKSLGSSRDDAAELARLRRENKKPRAERDILTGARPDHPLAENVLDRDFTAAAPNKRWVADFTYVWSREGWLYVATVLDLFSRRIVGWSMKPSMTADLVIDALGMAIWRRGKPDELLHHSDQGSQYTSDPFQRMLADLGIKCSLSRRGECHDNAVMESFYGSMKTEKLYRETYRTRAEARAAVFDYIEGFYNPHRRHSTLGNISPAAFEQQALCA